MNDQSILTLLALLQAEVGQYAALVRRRANNAQSIQQIQSQSQAIGALLKEVDREIKKEVAKEERTTGHT